MEQKLKQTAVDWLIKVLDVKPENEYQKKFIDDLISKAKEMEKRMVVKAFNEGEFNMLNSRRDECFEYKSGEDYYQQYYLTENDLI